MLKKPIRGLFQLGRSCASMRRTQAVFQQPANNQIVTGAQHVYNYYRYWASAFRGDPITPCLTAPSEGLTHEERYATL
jgi:hypothetical protein